MSKLLVTALTFTVLALVAAGGYHLVSNNLKTDSDDYGKLPSIEDVDRRSYDDTVPQRTVTAEEMKPDPEPTDMSNTATAEADIILKIPIIKDKQDGNPLSGVIITGYHEVPVVAGGEFIITPTHDDLENRIDTNTVLSERFRLIGVKNHTIELERYVTSYDTDATGEVAAIPKWQKVRVTTKACFDVVTLMLDVSYQLCLDTTEDDDGTPILSYEFIGRSTMPSGPRPSN